MSIVDLIIPKHCGGCGRLGSFICHHCVERLKQIKIQRCISCGKPSTLGYTHALCRRSSTVDQCISIYYYERTLQRIIKSVKYRLAKNCLTELLKAREPQIYQATKVVSRKSKNIVIQPIPLSGKRMRERGFNQALEVAKVVSRLTGFEIVDLLVKKDTKLHQAELRSRNERFVNIHDSFMYRDKKKGKAERYEHVILVDDVVTSGATVQEAASVLKENGVHSVSVISLAKG